MFPEYEVAKADYLSHASPPPPPSRPLVLGHVHEHHFVSLRRKQGKGALTLLKWVGVRIEVLTS